MVFLSAFPKYRLVRGFIDHLKLMPNYSEPSNEYYHFYMLDGVFHIER